jgi:hypothetical protein
MAAGMRRPRRRQVAVDVREYGARNVRFRVRRFTERGIGEVVPDVDDHEARVAEMRRELGRLDERRVRRRCLPGGSRSGCALWRGRRRTRHHRLAQRVANVTSASVERGKVLLHLASVELMEMLHAVLHR